MKSLHPLQIKLIQQFHQSEIFFKKKFKNLEFVKVYFVEYTVDLKTGNSNF